MNKSHDNAMPCVLNHPSKVKCSRSDLATIALHKDITKTRPPVAPHPEQPSMREIAAIPLTSHA
jgi:hypothetical protein